MKSLVLVFILWPMTSFAQNNLCKTQSHNPESGATNHSQETSRSLVASHKLKSLGVLYRDLRQTHPTIKSVCSTTPQCMINAFSYEIDGKYFYKLRFVMNGRTVWYCFPASLETQKSEKIETQTPDDEKKDLVDEPTAA